LIDSPTISVLTGAEDGRSPCLTHVLLGWGCHGAILVSLFPTGGGGDYFHYFLFFKRPELTNNEFKAIMQHTLNAFTIQINAIIQ
jgi:hypothetical protein